VRFVLTLAAATLLLAACHDKKGSSPHSTYTSHGVTVELPAGWRAARASLTPNLSDPREILAVGTYPLRFRAHDCAQVPVSALRSLGPHDAFIDLEERHAGGRPSSEFPLRPAHFGPGLGGPSEAGACVPGKRFAEHWFGFSDQRRHFYALVAFGPAASNATKDATWKVLDSLKVEPGR
jgi:hypothetical protein